MVNLSNRLADLEIGLRTSEIGLRTLETGRESCPVLIYDRAMASMVVHLLASGSFTTCFGGG